MRIRNKILLVFSILIIFSALSISILDFISGKDILLRVATSQLEVIADLKAKAIQDFFENLKDNVEIAQDYYNVKLNLPVMIKFSKNTTHPDYIKAKDTLDAQLRKWLKIKDEVTDIMLLSPEGNVVYAANEEHVKLDLGNVLPDPEQVAFIEGKKGIFISKIFLSPHEEHGYKFGLLVTAPVIDFEKRFIGVIAFEINMDIVYKYIQDYTGLGKTGETLVVRNEGDHILFLIPTRHDPGAALKRAVHFGSSFAIPAQRAAKGGSGSGIARDYRNKEVLTAWRYLPSLNWGMVAKIDLDEILASTRALRNQAVVYCFVIFILMIFVSSVMARSVTEPISLLHKGAEIVAGGNLDYRVGISGHDEISELSRAFDEMTESLKHKTTSIDNLNREIAERQQLEENQRLSLEILKIFQSAGALKAVCGSAVFLIKEHLGCEVVALRLKNGKDFPYFVNNGFPEDFIKLDNSLFIRDENGDIVMDFEGFPKIACACGAVVHSWFDSTKASFDPKGSFWSNSTSEFQSQIAQTDKKDGIRNTCSHFGYESIALIPLNAVGGNIGLLQLNDKRKNFFTAQIIEFLEEIGYLLGLGIMRKQTEEELVNVTNIKSSFTSMVAHDLRIPLTAIKESVDLVLEDLEGTANEDKRNFLNIAKKNIDRLSRLTTDVLDFQKLESRRMAFDIRENDINAVVEEVHQMMLFSAGEKGLDFNLDLGEGLPMALFDKDKIIEVLSNIVNNAIKFTDKGIVTIVTSSGDNAIKVSVSDTGPGIKEEDIPKLFGEFLQLSTDTKKRGTGLGLAICKSIIEQHKGKIWIESEAGRGATFSFILPAKESRA